MAKIINRTKKGSALTVAEMDSNLDILHGIVSAHTTTTYTVVYTDQGKVIECSNTSPVTITLDQIATILAAVDTTSFSVKIININTGLVTVVPSGSDTFQDGTTSLAIPKDGYADLVTNAAGTKWNKKRSDSTYDVKSYGAVGDGVADDTGALNLFFAAVAAGARGDLGGPDKVYKFTSALNAVNGHNLWVHGSGATLLYTGASTTPGDLLTFGDGVTNYLHLDLRGWSIGSYTTLTAGYGIHFRACSNIEFDIRVDGTITNSGKLWNGVFFEASSQINLHSSTTYVQNNGVTWTTGVELHCGHLYAKGSTGTIGVNPGSGYGIYVGGGCGGFYSESLTQIYNRIGMLVDTGLTGTANTQFFFSPSGTFDSNKDAAIYFNDAISSPISKIIRADGWFASSTVGNGVVIANWLNGSFDSGTGTFINNVGAGIACDDATVRFSLGAGVHISYNQTYGIDAASLMTIYSLAHLHNNTLGPYNTTKLSVLISAQSVELGTDPSTAWGLDYAGRGSFAIAAAGIKALATGSGIVVLHNDTTGALGLFLCYAGSVTKVAGAATMVSGAAGASQIGLAWNGGSSIYQVSNGYGTSQNIFITTIKTRAAS